MTTSREAVTSKKRPARDNYLRLRATRSLGGIDVPRTRASGRLRVAHANPALYCRSSPLPSGGPHGPTYGGATRRNAKGGAHPQRLGAATHPTTPPVLRLAVGEAPLDRN